MRYYHGENKVLLRVYWFSCKSLTIMEIHACIKVSSRRDLCVRNYHKVSELLLRVSCCICKSLESPTRYIPIQHVLEPWREVGRPNELHT
jgi:hypothetical protein